MKKLFAMIVLLLTYTGAQAQSDYSATWNLSGDDGLESITVDLDVGTTFISAHGGVLYDDGLTEPVTGTCFFTNSGGIFCTCSIIQGLTGILEIGGNLNGIWEVLDIDGFVIESGIATLAEVR